MPLHLDLGADQVLRGRRVVSAASNSPVIRPARLRVSAIWLAPNGLMPPPRLMTGVKMGAVGVYILGSL